MILASCSAPFAWILSFRVFTVCAVTNFVHTLLQHGNRCKVILQTAQTRSRYLPKGVNGESALSNWRDVTTGGHLQRRTLLGNFQCEEGLRVA
jgi:hypothetical protein